MAVTWYDQSLKAEFQLCSRPSRKVGDGAREIIQLLREIGGTILEVSYGAVHQDPEADVDERGSIIVRPGLSHPVLQLDALAGKEDRIGSCRFGYIHGSRTFDLVQSIKTTKTSEADLVAHGQLALADIIYRAMRPIYGWIDEPGENEPSTKRIENQELKYLFWANFYGPAYVERYGRDFLLGAPGWRKEELDDGGVLYVVDESYMHWRTTEATRAVRYFQLKVPAIRQYRSRGFGRSEALLEGKLKPKRRRRNRE